MRETKGKPKTRHSIVLLISTIVSSLSFLGSLVIIALNTIIDNIIENDMSIDLTRIPIMASLITLIVLIFLLVLLIEATFYQHKSSSSYNTTYKNKAVNTACKSCGHIALSLVHTFSVDEISNNDSGVSKSSNIITHLPNIAILILLILFFILHIVLMLTGIIPFV